jgi:hypothetical protein
MPSVWSRQLLHQATTIGLLTLAELLEEVGQRVCSEMQAQAVASREEAPAVKTADHVRTVMVEHCIHNIVVGIGFERVMLSFML